MKIGVVFVVLSLLHISAFAGQKAPTGRRFPVDNDYSGDWKEYRNEYPTPFHAEADFNGDGIKDDAWILISTNNTWGLCFYLSRKGNSPKRVWLQKGGEEPQDVGIEAVPPGTYKTVCEMGICGPDDPLELHLKRPAINFMYFGKSNLFYWWDEKDKTFRNFWMGD